MNPQFGEERAAEFVQLRSDDILQNQIGKTQCGAALKTVRK